MIEQALKFDKAEISNIKITQEEITQASNRLDKDLQDAILVAYENIKNFTKPKSHMKSLLKLQKALNARF